MRYKILKDGECINTIIADEEFCKAYCSENGFTHEIDVLPDPVHEPEPTTEDILNAMLGVSV